MNPLTYVLINGATIVLVWTGAVRVNEGFLTQGEVVALVNYMSQILVELVKLANLIININKSLACANRIASVFETESSLSDGTMPYEAAAGTGIPDKSGADAAENAGADMHVPAVEFSHVGLVYAGGGGEALSDIDFAVRPGETVGIIGGTGSGKSSVVNLIPRFYDATGGSVRVNGRDVREYALKELRRNVGIVPQKAVLFHGTIRDNMKWGNPDASDEAIMEALEIAQARDFVESKAGALDYVVEQGGKNFSGGQRQRLTIARAIVKKPDILILDDSASALDLATDAALRGAIKRMQGKMTVFIVSQRAASIRHADKIVVLEDGAVAGIGIHEELLRRCAVYREIYESQFGEATGGER